MFESRPDPALLVAVVESTHREESVLVARRMAAVAALLRHRVAATERAEHRRGYAVIDGFEQTTAEVAAAMNLSPIAAGYLVSDAEALDARLPKVAALLAEARTDWRTVRLIISRTDLLADDELIAKLDQSLAARIGNWHGWSRQRVINAVDAAVRTIDPDAARERRVAAEDDRHIGINALDSGMAEVYGTVAAAAATAFDRRLSQLAKQVCPEDPRTLDQRRADALAALTQGRRLGCRCGQPDCTNRTDEQDPESDPGGPQVVINVIASEQTVHGNSTQPGYLEGYGVIDAEQVRDLASAASLLIADPFTSPVEALRYQPSAALERAIRCRDLTCRFPGCSRPAVVCDIDHTIPFNHANPAAGGLTVAENLKCLCRQHHRLKTFHGGWRDTQLADGTVIWISPTGRTYRTSPAGADLFPLPRGPACTAPTPSRRSRSRQQSARIAQARKHNREQRPVNEARRRLEQARKEEIAARKFRNHMRDMLFLFKGKPSTSPYCTWVNDPRESEELPPDWTPEEPALQPLPDDPPFRELLIQRSREARVPGMSIAQNAPRLVRRSIAVAAAGMAIASVSACDKHNPTPGANPRQVTVIGSGQVQGVPDTLTADVGIEFTAPDVTAAMNQTNDRQQAVINALVGAGLDRKDISTTEVSLRPQYSNPEPSGTATITGYRATNAIQVKIHPTDAASRMLALIVSTGGDATRISSVRYSIADDSQLVKDARARAFNDAKNRADQYAQLSGLRLGNVLSISEATGSTPTAGGPPAPPRAMPSAVPLEPGQQEVSFSVTAVWELD